MGKVERICERLESDWERSSARRRIWKYIGVYTVVYILSMLLVYGIFFVEHRTFVWKNDGLVQHYALLTYVGRYIRKFVQELSRGVFSVPLFDVNMNLGDDVIGLLYSLGRMDPLLLSSALVPAKYTEYLFVVLTLLRGYLAGLSFSYLCFYFHKKKEYALTGSLIYCFSGHAIFSTMRHPYFMNPLISLPLLIVGTEKVLKKEGWQTFLFAVFYLAINGFYHVYMCTIVVLVYAFIRFFEIYRSNRGKDFISAVLRGALLYCLGIGLLAVVFIPSIEVFFSGTRADKSIYRGVFFGWAWLRRRLTRFISPPGSWDDMAFAAISLFALVLLMFSKRKERRGLKAFVIIAFCVYLTSVGNFFMNGLQYPSTRWTFVIALLVAYIVVEMLPELLCMSAKQVSLCAAVTGVYFICSLSNARMRTESYVWVGISFLLLTFIVLTSTIPRNGLMSGKPAGKRADWRGIACIILVIINVSVNGLYKFAADQGNYISEFTAFGTPTQRLEGAIERGLEPYLLSNPEGRADGSDFTRYFATVWRLPGMLTYSSLANANMIDFWNGIENCGNEQEFKIYSTDQRTIANTLLSQKYQVEREGKEGYVPFGYYPIETTDAGNTIYENKYALPWGYTYDSVISCETLEGLNGVQRQEAMLQAVALEETGSRRSAEIVYDEQAVPFEAVYQNCAWEDGVLSVKKANATITLNFDMPASVEGYVRLRGLNLDDSGVDSMTLTVACAGIKKNAMPMSDMATYYYGRQSYLFNLGYSDEERHELTITIPSKGAFKLDGIELTALPMDNYPERVESLREEPLENIRWGTNELTGTVDLSKDKILCVSVPYSKGWTATVDGEEAEILKGNYMFMCLPLTAGHHDVAFHYCTPGIKLGAVVSVASLCVVAGMLVCKRRKKKRQMEAC